MSRPNFSYSFSAARTAASTSASRPCPKNSFGTPMRSPFTGSFTVRVYAGTGSFTLVLSRSSCPAMASSSRAQSVTSWANGPT